MPIRPKRPLDALPPLPTNTPDTVSTVVARPRLRIVPQVTPPPDEPKPYAVGKNKPPLHSRWQKGQSGNPSGKNGKEKKALKDALAIGEEVLGEPVPVKSASGTLRMNSAELAFTKLRELVGKGSLPAIRYVIDFWQTAHAKRAAAVPGDGSAPQISPAEQAVLNELFASIGLPVPAGSAEEEEPDG